MGQAQIPSCVEAKGTETLGKTKMDGWEGRGAGRAGCSFPHVGRPWGP